LENPIGFNKYLQKFEYFLENAAADAVGITKLVFIKKRPLILEGNKLGLQQTNLE
jgi:hypothetical protein